MLFPSEASPNLKATARMESPVQDRGKFREAAVDLIAGSLGEYLPISPKLLEQENGITFWILHSCR